MDKRGLIKISAFLFILALIFTIVFSSLFSSAYISSEDTVYFVGDKIELNLENSSLCFMKIKSPTQEFSFKCNNKLSFLFNESGNYKFDIIYSDSSENFQVEVLPRNISIGYEEQEYNETSFESQTITIQEKYSSFNFKDKNTYLQYSTVKFDFTKLGNYELIIFSPSGKKISRIGSNDVFLLELLEEGDYSVDLIRGNGKTSYTFSSVKYIEPKLIQGKAEIGKPVSWAKKINLSEEGNFLEIPSALSMELKNENGSIFTDYTFVEVNGKNYILINNNVSETFSLNYITQAPLVNEEVISETKKQVVLSSPEDVHYINVLSYSSISERLLVGQENLIKIYWRENNTYLDFNASDTDGNGFLDYVEWITPHLSTQTFEIILITKAEHLDSNKSFISNIYEEVKDLDNLWSETISDNEYIRVTFEIPLDNTRDITLFPRIISGNPIVEVYEKDKNELIAQFNALASNEYNKVYLTNLQYQQDTFDLRVIGGSVEFDHIIDPQTVYNVNSSMRAYWGQPTSSNRWISGTNSSSSQYANMATENGVYASVAPPGQNDYPFYRFNFTINEDPSFISSIFVRFTGYDNAAETATIYVWRFANATWMPIGTTPAANGNVTRNITSDISSYIDNNDQFVVLVEGDQYDTNPSVDYIYVDYVGVTVQYTSETTPPVYNRVSVNNTSPGQITRFSINASDNYALHPNGGYIFSTNNSGSWVNDSFVTFSSTPSWANVTKTLSSTAQIPVGYRWFFNDTSGNRNSTSIYTLTTSAYPPSADQIQCEESGSWKDCNELGFLDILTRVRMNCTGVVSNASFNLTNIPDSYTFFNLNASSNETSWWIYDNPDLTINDSGQFNLTGTCYGSSSQTSDFVNWTVPWGSLEVNLVNPKSNTNVNPDEFFNFTASVSCINGECGNVNATLDPTGSWWNGLWGYRKEINISGVGTVLNNFQVLIIANLTSEFNQKKINSTCKDIRFTNSSGTLINHWIENCSLSGGYSKFWIKVPNLAASGNTTVYIYYGNPSVNSTSNGSATFEFFDDFEDGTLTDQWTIDSENQDGTVYINTTQGINGGAALRHNPDSSQTKDSYYDTRLRTTSYTVQNGTLNYDIYLGGSARIISQFGFRVDSLSFNNGYAWRLQNTEADGGFYEFTSGSWGGFGTAYPAISGSTWHNVQINITAGSDYYASVDGGGVYSGTDATKTTAGYLISHVHGVSLTSASYVLIDNIRVRKNSTATPSSFLGSEEEKFKGVIPMNSGNPFYTTSRNPMNYLGTSCLSDMKAGKVCNVTWQVNATGDIGSIWEFFVYANNTNYLNYFNSSDVSSAINITIGNLPPEVPELNFPANNSALTSIGEFNWSNSQDPTGDKVYYAIQISNSSNFSSIVFANYTIPEQSIITGVTPTGITQEGKYYWRVLATDLKSNSSWSEERVFYYDSSPPLVSLVSPPNSTTITYSNTIDFIFNVSDLSGIQSCNLVINNSIADTASNLNKNVNLTFSFVLTNSFYTWKVNCTDSAGRVGDSGTRFLNVSVSNNPPTARQINCEKNGIWYNCSSISFGDLITRVRVLCTDPEGGVVNASLNLTNIPDSYTFFNNFTFEDDSDGYWTLDNPDLVVNDSGQFTIMATCYDSESLSRTNFSTWEVPWGFLNLTLVNPSSNTYVMKNKFFNFTVNVSCIGGECGNANVTLDPSNWWNNSWEYRKKINITNTNSSIVLENGYSFNLTLDTTGSKFLDNGDDLRIVYWNGTQNIELDRINSTSFNSSSTLIWFKLQKNISALGVDYNYSVYYGNPSAINPPINRSNIYLFYDNFTDSNAWSDSSGACSASSLQGNPIPSLFMSGSGTTDRCYATNFNLPTSNFIIEADVYISSVGGRGIRNIGFKHTTSHASGYMYRLQTSGGDGGFFTLDGSAAWSKLGSNDADISADTWNNLRLLIRGTNFTAWVNGDYRNSVVSSTYSNTKVGTQDDGGADTDSYVDNYIVKSYISPNPNSSLGLEEELIKGIIPVGSGNPFYTTNSNPLNFSTTSCLSGMKSSLNSCNLNWQVNATGEIGSTWDFFVFANTTNYTNYFSSYNESSRIQITIVSQLAPTVPQLYRPLNASAFSSIPNLNWTNSTDVNGDSIYYAIQVSNTSDFSYINFANYSIRETTSPTNKTPTGITQEGTYYWRVLASDLMANSSWSETRVFYYVTSGPTITFINQTGEDNRIINSTNWLNRGENLTIFTNASSTSIDKVWVVVWQSVVGGIEKVKVFFTSLGNFLWKANIPTNQTWGGFYNYTIYSNDTLGSQINYSSNFTVLGGNITINLSQYNVDSIMNLTLAGRVNFTNSTALSNYPVNIWIDGSLLSLSNVTPIGTYDFFKEFQETSNFQFSQGTFYNTEIQGNENITLSAGVTSGNFTKILDAGAMVSWNNLSWTFQGASCSGVFSYQEGDSNSYSGTEDSYITSGASTTNYGTSTSIIVDGSPTSDRGIIKFDNIIGRAFNQIPENSTIINANLTLQVSDNGDQVGVYPVLENWTESEVTYNNRLTSSSWTSTGCSGSPSRAVNPDDYFTASSTGQYTVNITNSLKNFISSTNTNYGWIFNMPTSNGISFRSSEYSTQSERPKLTVEYQAGECTNLVVYIRTSNDKLTWSSWREISNGGLINDSNIYSRYLEYKVEFTSVTSATKPVLKDITINYTSLTTDSSGNYRYNFTNPSQFGNHNITVNTSYKQISMMNLTSLYVETGVAPNVSLISPNNNQWFSYGGLNLTYNATDVNNDFAFSELIINGVVNQTNSSPIGNYAYNNITINFTSGQYNWTVNVTDNSGYRATTSQRTFYIDLINPNISLIYPGNQSSFELNQLNLSFNATDNMDTNLTCSLVLDGTTIRSGIGAINGYIVNISSGIISGGIHYWNVTCTDNAMRNFTSSTFNFNISDTPPNVTLVSPPPNYLDNDGILSFIYNASDNTGFKNCSLILNETYRIWNTSIINNYQNNPFDVEGFLEGNYNWTVECFDLSGSPSKPSPRNFSMDLYKPTIVLNSPSNSGTSLSSNVRFNFTANDTFDSSLSCNLTVNGIVRNTSISNSGNLTSILITNLTDGLKYWNVTCADDTLNSNTSATWTVNITEYPSVILNTGNNSRFNQTSINLSYTPSDNTNLSSCRLYLNGVFNQSNSSFILNKQQNIFTLNGISEGIYNWYVNCTDYYGLSNQSETRRFYADRTPPKINISYPKGEDIYASNITFNFTVTDAIDSNISCNLTVNSSVLDINFTVNNGSLTSRIISGIGDGYNLWNLTCWDNAGNTNVSNTFNFTRYTNPAVTLISPDNNTWFNTSSITLIYLPEDDMGIINASLYINGIYNRSNSSSITNRGYNNFPISGFSDGSYYWNINVTDPTGLTGIGEERRFYVDTHAPSLRLNYPNESSIITTNNVTFNFTVLDNLDQSISCNFTLDGELESSGDYINNSNVIKYSVIGDGNHSWSVVCVDNASNFNYSNIVNFTVEAPPIIELVSPSNNVFTKNSTINFSYIPYDLIDIKNCSIYLDGVFNQSNISISENTLNNFTILGIAEGMHNWTVNCSDSDDNWNWSIERIFYRDISPPSIILNSPENNSGIDYNQDRIYFNWTTIDILDNVLQCNLTIDGIVRRPNVWVTNNFSKREYVLTSVLGQGEHSWNITCWDQMKNTNTSELRKFNLTYPDFSVNSSEIFLNETSPRENQSIAITATVRNIAGADIDNISISFYIGDPDLGGSKIGPDIFVNLSKFGQINVTQNWISQIGSSDIFVIVDPPLVSNGTYIELNESNNKAFKLINVGSWHFFYGDVLTSSNLVLANSNSTKLINWSTQSFNQGNIYVTDYDSYISWTSLQAIGKNKLNLNSNSDFSEMDSALNMNSFEDSVYSVYTNSGVPKYSQNIYSFGHLLQNVPIINSTNNSNFVTGILWDFSDDTNGSSGEFDLADKEDIIFISPINKHSEGTYGIYDYELRVPARLREYNSDDTKSAAFYVEIF